MNTRTYTRINEDFLDDQNIDVQKDVNIYEEVEQEVYKLLTGQDITINLCELPDSYYKLSNKDELEDLINQCLLKYGDECNLNWIDVSKITNMDNLFRDSYFNGDISQWDVHNVVSMRNMFCGSEFNKDISKWDVSNVKMFNDMFMNSNFNGNISDWNTKSA